VTLPRPDLPIVLLRTVGRCRSGATSRAAPYRQPASRWSSTPASTSAASRSCTVTEAVADFLRSDMGALFLGSLLVVEKPTPA
jgi:hypothetical protein